MDKRANQYLVSHAWPGNIRQLRNFIERLVVVSDNGIISLETVAGLLEPRHDLSISVPTTKNGESISEKDTILQTLKNTGFNQKEAAKILGINRSTLYRKLKNYGIEVIKIATRNA